MKFTKHITPKGLSVPVTALCLGGFEPGEQVECHVQPGTVILLKRRMTAGELPLAAQALHDRAVDLYVRLAQICGPCREDCGGCDCGPEDLEGLPPEAVEMFLEADVCLDELARHLREEDIVYGS